MGKSKIVIYSHRSASAALVAEIVGCDSAEVICCSSPDQIISTCIHKQPDLVIVLAVKPFINGSLLIDDAYNSNPEGCLEAVRVLGSFNGMQKVIVTPGLVELGDKEYEYNYDLGSEAAKHCDDIILVGVKRAVPLKKAAEDKGFSSSHLIVAESFKDAMEHLKNMTDNNTVVLFENDLPDNYAG